MRKNCISKDISQCTQKTNTELFENRIVEKKADLKDCYSKRNTQLQKVDK